MHAAKAIERSRDKPGKSEGKWLAPRLLHLDRCSLIESNDAKAHELKTNADGDGNQLSSPEAIGLSDRGRV